MWQSSAGLLRLRARRTPLALRAYTGGAPIPRAQILDLSAVSEAGWAATPAAVRALVRALLTAQPRRLFALRGLRSGRVEQVPPGG
jgi:hypothetical protein